MTDFVTQEENEKKRKGIFAKLKNFVLPKEKNQITLLSEAEFDTSIGTKTQREETYQLKNKISEGRSDIKITSPATLSVTINSGNIDQYKKRLFGIGNLPLRTQYLLCVLLMAFGISGLMVSYFLSNSNQYKLNVLQNNITTLVADLQSLSSVLNKTVSEENVLTENIKSQKDGIDRRISSINSGINDLGIGGNSTIQQMNINNNWSIINSSLNTLNNGAKTYDAKNFNDIISYLNGMNNVLMNYRINAEVVLLINSIERFKGELNSLYNANDIQMISTIKQDEEAIKNNLINVRWGKGNINISAYEKVGLMWIEISPVLNDFINFSVININGKKNIGNITDNINLMTNQINNGLFKYTYIDNPVKVKGYIIFGGSLILLLLTMLLIIMVYSYERSNMLLQEKLENSHNNQAIIRMLDEIGPYQEGDLTKKVTVNEDLTSAISDAINTMIDEFKVVVKSIRDSSENIDNRTKQAQEISLIISENGEEQLNQINKTADEVSTLTELIDAISHKTHKGENVANKTLISSEEGRESVKESIQAMNSIKVNMAETVRLMKRLDEFSNQISNIMDLLSDITEETRVLGENATVQASKAGEAGKGFKIVANAVTSLSHKATEATIKVSALVNATKTDIQEIVSSVERTNIEIEKGTQLSAKAGTVLEEIKDVSIKLTEIIKDISKDSKNQVNKANEISTEIKNIKQLARNSTQSNITIVESIKEMKDVSNNLKKDVRHFKID